MKKILSIFTLSSLFMISGCSTPTTPSTSDDSVHLKGIVEEYKSYEKINDKRVKSNQHGGIFVNTLINKTGIDSFRNKKYPYAEGSVVIKEGFDSETSDLSKIYVMKKIKGYDPQNGDWLYAVTDPSGKVQMSGKIQMCISCHVAGKDKDYVFGFN